MKDPRLSVDESYVIITRFIGMPIVPAIYSSRMIKKLRDPGGPVHPLLLAKYGICFQVNFTQSCKPICQTQKITGDKFRVAQQCIRCHLPVNLIAEAGVRPDKYKSDSCKTVLQPGID